MITKELTTGHEYTLKHLHDAYGGRPLLVENLETGDTGFPDQIKIIARSRDTNYLKLELNIERGRWFSKDQSVKLLSDKLV